MSLGTGVCYLKGSYNNNKNLKNRQEKILINYLFDISIIERKDENII